MQVPKTQGFYIKGLGTCPPEKLRISVPRIETVNPTNDPIRRTLLASGRGGGAHPRCLQAYIILQT